MAGSLIIKIAMPHPKTGKPLSRTLECLPSEIDEDVHGWSAFNIQMRLNPHGEPLTECIWHSGPKLNHISFKENDPEHCNMNPFTGHGIWTEDYICYDECHKDTERALDRLRKRAEAMNTAQDFIDEYIDSVFDHHTKFVNQIDERNRLKGERDSIRGLHAKASRGIDVNNPQYVTLLNIQKREKDQLDNFVEQATQRYTEAMETDNKAILSRTMKAYVNDRTYEARLNLQKATEAFNNWVNKQTVSQATVDEIAIKLRDAENKFTSFEKMVREAFRIPFYLVTKAISQILDISTYICYFKSSHNGDFQIGFNNDNNARSPLRSYKSSRLVIMELRAALQIYHQFEPSAAQREIIFQEEEESQAQLREAERNQKTGVVAGVTSLPQMIIGLDGEVREADESDVCAVLNIASVSETIVDVEVTKAEISYMDALIRDAERFYDYDVDDDTPKPTKKLKVRRPQRGALKGLQELKPR